MWQESEAVDKEGLGQVPMRLRVFVNIESGPKSSEDKRPKEQPISACLSGPGYGGPGRKMGLPLLPPHTPHGSMRKSVKVRGGLEPDGQQPLGQAVGLLTWRRGWGQTNGRDK